MNIFVKNAAEKWALQVISLQQLSVVCGSKDEYCKAVTYGVEFLGSMDSELLSLIYDILIDNFFLNNEKEVGELIYNELRQGNTLEGIYIKINSIV